MTSVDQGSDPELARVNVLRDRHDVLAIASCDRFTYAAVRLHDERALHAVTDAQTATLTVICGAGVRYQLDFVEAEFANLTVEQHVAHARTAQRDDLRAYIARGGLPPVVGEWALAGALSPRRCPVQAGEGLDARTRSREQQLLFRVATVYDSCVGVCSKLV